MERPREQFHEFLRYAVVGGVSFLVDMGSLALGREWLFRSLNPRLNLSLSTALGFLLGLLCNYFLSNAWVFRGAAQKARGRTLRGFLTFTVIGVVGLLLTELGMHWGVKLVGDKGFYYLLVKCVVAGLVLIWNYGARKALIYKNAGTEPQK